MQPLERMDAAFLSLETPTTPMHVGVVLVLDPPEGTRSLFSPVDPVRPDPPGDSATPAPGAPVAPTGPASAFRTAAPVWVDDPDFDLDDHLTRASLPAPGGQEELDAYVATVMGRQLDPDRPLWEMYVVEGLEGERTALMAKVHHAILDGVSGVFVLAAFLDLSPRSRVVALPTEWRPDPLPSTLRCSATPPARWRASPARRGHDEGRSRDHGRCWAGTTKSSRAAASGHRRDSSPGPGRRSTAPFPTASASLPSRFRSTTSSWSATSSRQR